MNLRVLKYATIYTGPLFGFISLTFNGWLTWALPLYAFGLIPLVEFFMKGTTSNLNGNEEKEALNNPWFDYLVYSMLPIQLLFLVYFFFSINQPGLTAFELAGRTLSMGIGCAVLGINVAHELGHRKLWYEQLMAKILLLTSLYMHFFIEHNRGHHKRVSTPEDPASSRYGESLYAFIPRSVVFGFVSAWHLEADRLKKAGVSVLSWRNEMIWYQVIQIAVMVTIAMVFNLKTAMFFVLAAMLGFLFLEVVNYIEHYGLQRKQKADGSYEKVLPIHSWNSNHEMGRIILFDLTRHSDHHYKASRKYQILRHFEEAPQMPTGYPGMMLLSFIPPLWFKVMHRQIDHYRSLLPQGVSIA